MVSSEERAQVQHHISIKSSVKAWSRNINQCSGDGLCCDSWVENRISDLATESSAVKDKKGFPVFNGDWEGTHRPRGSRLTVEACEGDCSSGYSQLAHLITLHLLENRARHFQRAFSPACGWQLRVSTAELRQAASSTADMLKFRGRGPAILYWGALRKHPNVRKQVGRSRLSPGPWPRKQKKPRQFETADASSAEPSQHASLQITANFPSSKLLLLPGLNTVCSLFKATETGEENPTYSSEIVLFYSCAVLCASPVMRSCTFQWNHCSLSSLIPQNLSIGLSGFYALTIANGLNAPARSTSGFISLNIPFSKSTVISISARNCFKISTGSWE